MGSKDPSPRGGAGAARSGSGPAAASTGAETAASRGSSLHELRLLTARGRSGGAPKVLFVATVAATLRGFLLPYAKQLREKGWIVDGLAVGATASPPCLAVFRRCFEASWSRNPLGLRGLFRAPALLRELVEREGYDLVHVHTPVAAFLTRWALRSLRPKGVRLIYTAHGFHFHRGGGWLSNRVFVWLERLASNWTDYLVLINEEDHLVARRLRLCPSGRILRMPGIGVEVEAYAASMVDLGAHDALCSELGISKSARLVVMVAEFTRNKRHRDLIEAVSELGRSDLHLLLVGDGPERRRCEVAAKRLGLEGRVHFLGVRADVPRLLAASVCSVLPSAREGMPRVVMESLCMGIPVVGTDVRGTRDLLSSGAGIVVSVGAVRELADAIAHLLEHEQVRKRMGARGTEVIAAYDLRHTLGLNAALYAAAIRGEALPRPARRGARSLVGSASNVAVAARLRAGAKAKNQAHAPAQPPGDDQPRAG